MKKFLTLRNVLLASAAFIGVLFFALSFATKVNFPAEGNLKFNNVIWGSSTITYNGEVYPMSKIFDGLNVKLGPLALPLVGVILILVAAVALCVAIFAIEDQKVAKIVILVAAGLFVLGGVFQFIVIPSLKTSMTNAFVKVGLSQKEAAEEAYVVASYAQTGTLSTISGVFSIIAGLVAGAAPFLPEKQLVK